MNKLFKPLYKSKTKSDDFDNSKLSNRLHFVKSKSEIPQGDEYKQYTVDISKCKDEKKLFAVLQNGLEFPSYFGHNWWALDECLWDFYWVSNDYKTSKVNLFITGLDKTLLNEDVKSSFCSLLNQDYLLTPEYPETIQDTRDINIYLLESDKDFYIRNESFHLFPMPDDKGFGDWPRKKGMSDNLHFINSESEIPTGDEYKHYTVDISNCQTREELFRDFSKKIGKKCFVWNDIADFVWRYEALPPRDAKLSFFIKGLKTALKNDPETKRLLCILLNYSEGLNTFNPEPYPDYVSVYNPDYDTNIYLLESEREYYIENDSLYYY